MDHRVKPGDDAENAASIAQAMRLEGWPRMGGVQTAILRDDRLRCAQPVSYATTAKPLREDEVPRLQ
jgi:hypothetical protein